MKECLTCHERYFSSAITCPSCGVASDTIDGFIAYAPELAIEGEGYKSIYFEEVATLEAKNFWFRARNRLIIWALTRYHPNLDSFLEIGCGTGYVLSGIADAFPHARLQGTDLFTKGLSFASSRLPHTNLIQMDARKIPFINEFDAIGAFDVIEHIEEDKMVLQQIHKALKPEGTILLTVPQHQWLWSTADEHACHVRRYSAKDLEKKLNESGFEIVRSTSFVTSLLLPMLLSRLTQMLVSRISSKTISPTCDLNLPSWLNFIFEMMLNVEIRLIKRGINFKIGGSRIVVARKI